MIGGVWSRLRALFLPDRVSREIDDEMREHLAHDADQLVARGMSRENADREVRRRFGNVTAHAESAREAYGWSWLSQGIQDLRFAGRTLRRTPGFTLVVVLSLAIAIGANSAIFSAIDALLLRPLPVTRPQELVTLEQAGANGSHAANYAFADYEAFAKLDNVFSGVSATTWADGFNVSLAGEGAATLATDGAARVSIVTGNYFSVFGVGATAGRVLLPDDDRDGAPPAVVISHPYWTRRFGASKDVVGRTVSILGTSYTVVGIASAQFEGEWVGWPTDLWLPVSMVYRIFPFLTPGAHGGPVQYKLIARLRRGVSIAQAQAAGEVVHRRLATTPVAGSGVDKTMQLSLASAAAGYSSQRDQLRRPLFMLMGIVVAVLLIACANVANLLLARAASRQRELGVRLAIGAGRWRLARQLLTESLFLGTMGAVAGLFVAEAGTHMLGAITQSGPATSVIWGSPSVILDLGLSWRVVLFTTAASIVAVVLFGVMPAVRASRIPVGPAVLGHGSTSARSLDAYLLRGGLVVGQVALSLLLITAATLFGRSMGNMQTEQLGFDRSRLALVWTVPGYKEASRDALLDQFISIQDRLAAIPGVSSVSASSVGVLSGSAASGPAYRREGADSSSAVFADNQMIVGPRFFSTVGQRLIAGREFNANDVDSARSVIVVDEGFARRMFGRVYVVGQRLLVGRGPTPKPAEIVGVVSDAQFARPMGSRGLVVYSPYTQARNLRRLCFVVRAAGAPSSVISRIRQEIRAVDPDLPILEIDTADQQLDRALFRDRLVARLAAVFGFVALVLACIGLFGLMSYTTQRRTNEIGIRMALGATPMSIVRMILGQSMTLMVVGCALGVFATVMARRVISSQLYGIGPGDPTTVAVIAALFLGVTIVATWIPARRAAGVDPLVALRSG